MGLICGKHVKHNEDLDRARRVNVCVEKDTPSEEEMQEILRREAMETMTVNCLVVNTNETVKITAVGWKLIRASVGTELKKPAARCAVSFGGIAVNEDETFEDLGIETDATLTVVCTDASGNYSVIAKLERGWTGRSPSLLH